MYPWKHIFIYFNVNRDMHCDYNHPYTPITALNLFKIINHPYIYIYNLSYMFRNKSPLSGRYITKTYETNIADIHIQV
jgi:hypothetical protein